MVCGDDTNACIQDHVGLWLHIGFGVGAKSTAADSW